MRPLLKRRKNLGFYETLLAEIWFYTIYLRMASENFEEMF